MSRQNITYRTTKTALINALGDCLKGYTGIRKNFSANAKECSTLAYKTHIVGLIPRNQNPSFNVLPKGVLYDGSWK